MRPRANRVVAGWLVAVLTVASAAALTWSWLAGSSVTAAAPNATMDGATVMVGATEWAPMEHLEGAGFAMPDQMMPGAPTGDQVRLGVDLTLTNTRSATYEFSLVDEFTLTGGQVAEPAPLRADTVGELGRLGPGATLHAKLYFDVLLAEQAQAAEPADPADPMYLKWTRGRDTVRIPVPLPGGQVPEHNH